VKQKKLPFSFDEEALVASAKSVQNENLNSASKQEKRF